MFEKLKFAILKTKVSDVYDESGSKYTINDKIIKEFSDKKEFLFVDQNALISHENKESWKKYVLNIKIPKGGVKKAVKKLVAKVEVVEQAVDGEGDELLPSELRGASKAKLIEFAKNELGLKDLSEDSERKSLIAEIVTFLE